ncbi:MAG: hypothetical protein AMXMBFR33_40580 [Candidatus Xenobia bacterium]
MASGNTLRTNLGVVGYESFNVHTGLTRQVPSSATTSADGGIAHVGEQFTPTGNRADDEAMRAEQLLMRWNQAETTPETLGRSAEMAREVGFEAPKASEAADPGNLGYLTGGTLTFDQGGIGNHLLGGGSPSPAAERSVAQHEGWLIS